MKNAYFVALITSVYLSSCNILPTTSGGQSGSDENKTNSTEGSAAISTGGSYSFKNISYSCKSTASNRCPAISIKVSKGNNGRHILVKNEHDYPKSIGKFSATFSGCRAVYSTQCDGDAGDIVDLEIRNEDTTGKVGVNVRFQIPENDILSWNYDGT